MTSFLRNFRGEFEELIEKVSQDIKKSIKIEENHKSRLNLKGQRQSLEVLEDQNHFSKNLHHDFLNHSYFNDKTYFEYKDWK